MALVPDINGVCSIEGTRAMTSKPRMMARAKMYAPSSKISVMTLPSVSLLPRHSSRWNLLGAGDAGGARDFVLKIKRELTILHEVREDGHNISGVHLTGVDRNHAWQVQRPENGDVVTDDGLAGYRQRAVAA